MHTLNAQNPESVPASFGVPLWLAVFFSPTAYIFLLLAVGASQVAVPPSAGVFLVLLLCLVPVAALLTCGAMIWRSNAAVERRLGGLVLTTLAMLLQCGVWYIIIVSAITVAISPAQ